MNSPKHAETVVTYAIIKHFNRQQYITTDGDRLTSLLLDILAIPLVP